MLPQALRLLILFWGGQISQCYVDFQEVSLNVKSCLLECMDLNDANLTTRCEIAGAPSQLDDEPAEKLDNEIAADYCDFTVPITRKSTLEKIFMCVYSDVSLRDGLSAAALIDANFCTHVLVEDFFHHSSNGTPEERPDSATMLDAVEQFRAAGVKVIAQVGTHMPVSMGTQPLHFAEVAAKAKLRTGFVAAVLKIVLHRELDGVNVFWFYPGCPYYVCKSNHKDKKNFVLLVQEFQRQFKEHDLIVAAVLPPFQEFLSTGIDIKPLSEALDLMLLVTGDFQRSGKLGLSASIPDVAGYLENIISQVSDPGKLLAVVRNCIFDYKNVSLKERHKLGAPASAGTMYGMQYSQICMLINKKNYTVVRNPETQNFAYKSGHWFSFDDEQLVQRKTDMFVELGIGGVWVYNVEWDDPLNECGCGKFPHTKSYAARLIGGTACVLPKCV